MTEEQKSRSPAPPQVFLGELGDPMRNHLVGFSIAHNHSPLTLSRTQKSGH
jgi:hypothetical protein